MNYGRPCEIATVCEYCPEPAYAADSLPWPGGAKHAHDQQSYRWVPLCWRHTLERRGVATNRITMVLICESQGIARLDYDRAGGGALCMDCGRELYRHPADADYPFLTVRCDGSLVKL